MFGIYHRMRFSARVWRCNPLCTNLSGTNSLQLLTDKDNLIHD